MQSRVFLTVGLGCAVCGLSALAGEPRRLIDASRALDAGPPPGPEVVIARTPPDPPPLVEREQWIFDLKWDRGDVWLLGTQKIDRGAPQPTPRVIGRFALELYEGKALVERVRFDFPLLGPPEPVDAGYRAQPSFAGKLRTRIGVVFPATRRGTRLELVDRATERRWSLPWPVETAAPLAPTPSAGPS